MQYADLQSVKGLSGPTIISPQPLVGLNLPELAPLGMFLSVFFWLSSRLRGFPRPLRHDKSETSGTREALFQRSVSLCHVPAFHRSKHLLVKFPSAPQSFFIRATFKSYALVRDLLQPLCFPKLSSHREIFSGDVLA